MSQLTFIIACAALSLSLNYAGFAGLDGAGETTAAAQPYLGQEIHVGSA